MHIRIHCSYVHMNYLYEINELLNKYIRIKLDKYFELTMHYTELYGKNTVLFMKVDNTYQTFNKNQVDIIDISILIKCKIIHSVTSNVLIKDEMHDYTYTCGFDGSLLDNNISTLTNNNFNVIVIESIFGLDNHIVHLCNMNNENYVLSIEI